VRAETVTRLIIRWPQQKINLDKITKLVDKERKELPTYQVSDCRLPSKCDLMTKFLTAYPQIVSRIGHPNKDLAGVLKKIMAAVIVKYPLQSLWPTVGMMQSKRAERKTLCQSVLSRVQVSSPSRAQLISGGTRYDLDGQRC
jgi:serine/threonine-protein kinase ATR